MKYISIWWNTVKCIESQWNSMQLDRIKLPIKSLSRPAVNSVLCPSLFLTLYWRVMRTCRIEVPPRPLDVLTLFLTPAIDPVLGPSLFLTLCSTESGHTAPAQVHTWRFKGIFCQMPVSPTDFTGLGTLFGTAPGQYIEGSNICTRPATGPQVPPLAALVALFKCHCKTLLKEDVTRSWTQPSCYLGFYSICCTDGADSWQGGVVGAESVGVLFQNSPKCCVSRIHAHIFSLLAQIVDNKCHQRWL